MNTKTLADLKALMLKVNMKEEDLQEHFVRSQGPGGQKVNKSATSVVIKHGPSGLSVKVQLSRSQADNRFYARRQLALLLEEAQFGKQSTLQQAILKKQRNKKKATKAASKTNDFPKNRRLSKTFTQQAPRLF